MADLYCLDGAHDALNKMRRASARGTGCHLTADEIASLSLTFIGQAWEDDDPRDKDSSTQPQGDEMPIEVVVPTVNIIKDP